MNTLDEALQRIQRLERLVAHLMKAEEKAIEYDDTMLYVDCLNLKEVLDADG